MKEEEYRDKEMEVGLTKNRLINEASIKAKQSGERGVSARSIRRVSERTLRGYKG